MAAIPVNKLGGAKVYLREGKMVLTQSTPPNGVIPKALETSAAKFKTIAPQCAAAAKGLPAGKRGAAYKGCIALNMRKR